MDRANHELRIEGRADLAHVLLDGVLKIADAEKEALGFLPHAAFRDAISQQRLLVAVRSDGEVVGFLLFGGVFPHARVQQIGVAPDKRRLGIGTFLLRHLLERLEREGFLSVKAKVASDLTAAQAFYAKRGFEEAQAIAGGQARHRTIVVRVRHLETPSLLDAHGGAIDWSSTKIPLALLRSPPGSAPFYVIDLNVLFDLVRDRARSEDAHHLFSAALAHTLRIAVAGEFVEELKRTSLGRLDDPLLKLAARLPRLPKVDPKELASLAKSVHKIVFERGGSNAAGSPQAESDARHLAHATLAKASGFITSDGALLAARDDLLATHGIDVAGLDELVALLPTTSTPSVAQSQGLGLTFRVLSEEEARSKLVSLGAPSELVAKFCADTDAELIARYGVLAEDQVIALGVLLPSSKIDAQTALLVQVPQNHELADVIADHLFDVLLERASVDGPAGIELHRLPGQTLVSRVAEAKGFAASGPRMEKVALGRPLTPENWSLVSAQLRRRMGIELSVPAADRVAIKDSAGHHHNVPLPQLEEMLSPTIVAWPGREAAIVAIRRAYADELLNTSNQGTLSLLEKKPAGLLTRRSYVSSPRNAGAIRIGSPIFFYESERSGGRAGIVAVARVVDSLVQPKERVSAGSKRRLVVDDFDSVSTSRDVLVTTFDSILRFPAVVLRRDLEKLGALGTNNLQAATRVSTENFRSILNMGWSL